MCNVAMSPLKIIPCDCKRQRIIPLAVHLTQILNAADFGKADFGGKRYHGQIAAPRLRVQCVKAKLIKQIIHIRTQRDFAISLPRLSRGGMSS